MTIKIKNGKVLNSEKVKEAIKIKCLDCCGYNLEVYNKELYQEAIEEVINCPIKNCALYEHR